MLCYERPEVQRNSVATIRDFFRWVTGGVSAIALLSLAACGSGGSGGDPGIASDPIQAEAYNDVSLELNRVPGDSERAAIDQYAVWFPRATAVAPIIKDGTLPGWYNIGSGDFSRYVYPSQSPPLKADPHYFQFRETASEFDNSLAQLLAYVATQTGLPIDASDFVEVEAYGDVFGDTLRAGFNSVVSMGENIDWFIDVLTQADGNIVVNVIYARESVFDGWDGILLPLVFNGYVQDPGIFNNRDVFLAGTDRQKTDFYSAMINTKVLSEFGTFITLSAGAQQAMDNAVTISECALASNCTISYVGGRAVSNYQ